MSVRTYSRRPKSILGIAAVMMAEAIMSRNYSSRNIYNSQRTTKVKTNTSTKTYTKKNSTFIEAKQKIKKQKQKNKQVSKDISQTLEMIEKQLEKYGLTEEEIEKEINNIEEDTVEEQIISAQEQVCETIRNKVSQNPTMQIESEEILEDNSVVITINL